MVLTYINAPASFLPRRPRVIQQHDGGGRAPKLLLWPLRDDARRWGNGLLLDPRQRRPRRERRVEMRRNLAELSPAC